MNAPLSPATQMSGEETRQPVTGCDTGCTMPGQSVMVDLPQRPSLAGRAA